MKADRRSRGIALFFNLGCRGRGGGWRLTPHPGHFTPGKDLIPIVEGAGWAPGPVWTGAKNLAATGILSPGRPACSGLLYQMSYPGSQTNRGSRGIAPKI